MKIIIPLAGPDFVDRNGTPVLKNILEARFWVTQKEKKHFSDFYFVLQDNDITRTFREQSLKKWFPGCQAIFIPHKTAGAAFSALAAVSLLCDHDEPLCIDLADIQFQWVDEHPEIILSHHDCAGIIPVFESTKSHYSYVITNTNNMIIESKEKEVISHFASAGVYFFRNTKTYITAINFALHHPSLKFNDAYYICPLANAFTKTKQKMKAIMVRNVQDFHHL